MYKFPEIRTIDDVLPHVKDWPEFVVADRPDYTVINYNVAFPGTFSTEYEGWEFRRECRGLIFDKNGNIMSRPFHKFFNVNEMPDTHESKLSLDEDHMVLVKEDGSMIRPVISNNRVRLGTKMGVTDVSTWAEEALRISQNQTFWMIAGMEMDLTPLFEYTGPDNRIVLEYDKPNLVLLAVRNNITGEYLRHDCDYFKDAPFDKVESYGTMGGDIQEFIRNVRAQRDAEGNVVFWPNTGQMVKFKNDWYVQLHKILDQIRAWRHVADKMYKSEIDDVLPKVSEEDRMKLVEFMSDLREAESNMVDKVRQAVTYVYVEYGYNKKRIALEYVNDLPADEKWLAKFIFAEIDGKGTVESLVRNRIIDMTGSETKFDECLQWLNMEKYTK